MMIALVLLATSVPDLETRRFFTLSARLGPATCFAYEGRLYDDYLGNIDVAFTGIQSAFFSIDEGSGRFEPAALFEFDEKDRLVRHVHFIFDSVFSEEVRTYEGDKLVSRTYWVEESPAKTIVHLQTYSHDDSGRLLSMHRSVDGIEQSRVDYSYSSDGQVILVETDFVHAGGPKITTTRIQSNLFGYVTHEWKQEEGSPERLIRRYEYDDQGRTAIDASVNDFTGELFTQTLTYSQDGPPCRIRSISGPGGRLWSRMTSYLSASGKPIRDEYLDYSDDSLDETVARKESFTSECRYDQQGCFVRSLRQGATTRAIAIRLRRLERDGQGTVTGWEDFSSSGRGPLVRTRHVRIDLKHRTAPR